MLFWKKKTDKSTRKDTGTAEKRNRITNERIRVKELEQADESNRKEMDWLDELEMFEDIFDE